MRLTYKALRILGAAAMTCTLAAAQDAVLATAGLHASDVAVTQARDPRPIEPLDFDWAPGGVALPAGVEINEQWASIGVHIWADNNVLGHPDKAILFDSDDPTGEDLDLQTPGVGQGNMWPQGKVLIIAEDDVDADSDGLVDDPDDESGGGTFFFGFDSPMLGRRIGLLDVDELEDAWMRCWLRSRLMQTDFISGMGDNSFMSVAFDPEPMSYMETELTGSGAVTGLELTLCPVVVAVDEYTTGTPTGLQLGEVLKAQYRPRLGFRVDAYSASGVDKCVVFDSANPTGGDFDLQTPGTHPSNTVPYKKVMILADNDVDANGDGLIDEPGDDPLGGMLVIRFDFDVTLESATVIDIDSNELAWFELYNGRGAPLGLYPLSSLGDNSVETILPAVNGVRRIELHMTGSGALADLQYCRDG